MDQQTLQQLVITALNEDIGSGDVTAQLIPPAESSSAIIISRENAIVCGTAFVEEVFRQLDPSISVNWLVGDGDAVTPDQISLFTGRKFTQLADRRADRAEFSADTFRYSHIDSYLRHCNGHFGNKAARHA